MLDKYLDNARRKRGSLFEDKINYLPENIS